MLKVLSIGNSFSDDAQAWAHEVFASAGEEALFGNLYIGGCSLERHLHNAQTHEAAYSYRRNMVTMGDEGTATLDTGLLDEDWDYVTFQQASHFSGQWPTYEPYLRPLADYVRRRCPNAKFAVHQTWAYEQDSTHPGFAHYENSQARMYVALHECYDRAAKLLDAPVIPCGDAVQIARALPPFDYAHGGKSLNRDGFHLSLVGGRYLAALVWFGFFTGRSPEEVAFVPEKNTWQYAGMKDGQLQLRLFAREALTAEEAAALRQAAARVTAHT